MRGFRLRAGKYQRIRPAADGSIESKLIADGTLIRLIDPQTGRMIPSRLEREEEARKREREALEREAAKDAEIARLKALLEESRRAPNGRAKS